MVTKQHPVIITAVHKVIISKFNGHAGYQNTRKTLLLKPETIFNGQDQANTFKRENISHVNTMMADGVGFLAATMSCRQAVVTSMKFQFHNPTIVAVRISTTMNAFAVAHNQIRSLRKRNRTAL